MKLKWIGLLLMLHACVVSVAEEKPNVLWITGEDMSAKWPAQRQESNVLQ